MSIAQKTNSSKNFDPGQTLSLSLIELAIGKWEKRKINCGNRQQRSKFGGESRLEIANSLGREQKILKLTSKPKQ